MRRRGPMATIAASPTMVGAVTTLIVIVAVFLAYNANTGLPFVPVYRVSVEIPDAARLTNNNEVRIGGHRVGVVESIDAVQPDEANAPRRRAATNAAAGQTGGAVARLNLKLDKSAEPLPKDSVFRVRYRSTFGLKYLEIVRGEGDAGARGLRLRRPRRPRPTGRPRCYLPGDPRFAELRRAPRTAASSRRPSSTTSTTPSTPQTRTNARTNLEGFGNAFAGRGTSLNDAINSARAAVQRLRPVAQVLLEPRHAAAPLLPRARRRRPDRRAGRRAAGGVFTKGAIAFAAISSDPDALQETISEGAPTLETGIDLLPRAAPVPARLRAPSARSCARASTTCARRCRCSTTRSRSAPRCCARSTDDQPATSRAPCASSTGSSTQPTTRITLQRLERHLRRGEAAGRSRSRRRRRSATT